MRRIFRLSSTFEGAGFDKMSNQANYGGFSERLRGGLI
jgi:hypothetical protein